MGSTRSRNSPAFKTTHPRKAASSRLAEQTPLSPDGGRLPGFKVPSSSLQTSLLNDGDKTDDADNDMYDGSANGQEDDEGLASDEGGMDVDSEEDDFPTNPQTNGRSRKVQSSTPYDWGQHGSSRIGHSPKDLKRSQVNFAASYTSSRHPNARSVKRKDSNIPMIAKGLTKRLGSASLNEPDNMILETEELVGQLYPVASSGQDDQQMIEAALVAVPDALSKLWQTCCNQTRRRSQPNEVVVTNIGPNENDPPLAKATFLSTLLLKLHHPPAAKGKQAFAMSRSRRTSNFANSLQLIDAPVRLESYPRVLLDWLDQHHNPYQNSILELISHHPNSTAHLNFWDIVFACTLRGKLGDVIRIFNGSDFSQARTARGDGQSRDGYGGVQLKNIQRVMTRAVQILEMCPAIQDDDWDTSGTDWVIFRRRVGQAMGDLASFAEGRDRDLDPAESTFQAENFGMRSTSNALSQSARRVESKVPWTIYQNLKTLYGLLLGGTTEIISVTQDWLEAVIGLAVWWDGDDNDEIAVGSLAMTRRSLRRSQSQIPRSVDINVTTAYLRRIAYAFERVTDEAEEGSFQIDSNSPMEVGLACIFEGNVEAVLNFLHAWSLPVVSAVVETASIGGWFESAPGSGRVNGFDESDLMVLSYGQPEKGLTRDGVLLDYAQALFVKESIQDPRRGISKEGWELSIELLNRLGDTSLANKHIGTMLGSLSLHSDLRADKLIGLCRIFGLEKEACEIAEVSFGDSVIHGPDSFTEIW